MTSRLGFLITALLLSASVASGQIVVNGDFEGGTYSQGNDTVPSGWTPFETFSGSLSELSVIDVVNGNGPSRAGASCFDANRSLGGLSGDWTSIEQELSECVHTAASLTLDLDVRVMSHDLHAGGNFSFEWPVNVVIFYTDTAGNSRSWLWGFYLANPGTGTMSSNETLVPSGTWTSHNFNLLNELTNPARLDIIRVGGSGWNFHGQVDNVRITASAPPPLFPGTSDDVRLRHSINGGPFLCDELIIVSPGDLITLHADTPGGTFIGSEMLIAGEILPIGVILPPPFFGIAVSGNPLTTFLIAGGPVNGVGSTTVYGHQGHFVSYHWPISMTGRSLTTQAFALSINALNSIFGTSDGQRLE